MPFSACLVRSAMRSSAFVWPVHYIAWGADLARTIGQAQFRPNAVTWVVVPVTRGWDGGEGAVIADDGRRLCAFWVPRGEWVLNAWTGPDLSR